MLAYPPGSEGLMRRSLLPLGLLCVCGYAVTGCAPIDETDAYVRPAPEVFVADRAPPAISGGTLILSHDRKTAVAADPDRDRVWAVDLASSKVAEIPLQSGDEPGR